jgi:ABC-type uncharacterized transport system substrate-binding protein
MRFFLLSLLGVSALFGSLPAARAHPHVWMDLEMGLHTKGGTLTGIDLVWAWDEVYSDHYRTTYDRNRNGRFEPPEAKDLIAQEITLPQAFSDFVFVYDQGTRVPVGRLQNLTVDLKDKQMVFRFYVPLTRPIVLKGAGAARKVTVGSYDPEYYIESLLPENRPGVTFIDPAPACSVVIHEDRAHPIFQGLAYPQVASLQCPD